MNTVLGVLFSLFSPIDRINVHTYLIDQLWNALCIFDLLCYGLCIELRNGLAKENLVITSAYVVSMLVKPAWKSLGSNRYMDFFKTCSPVFEHRCSLFCEPRLS